RRMRGGDFDSVRGLTKGRETPNFSTSTHFIQISCAETCVDPGLRRDDGRVDDVPITPKPSSPPPSAVPADWIDRIGVAQGIAFVRERLGPWELGLHANATTMPRTRA